MLLEGSRYSSGGQRVELDLSYLKNTKTPFSLFPGQIVAVEGMNSSGRKLVAHRICEDAAQEAPKTSVKQLLCYHHDDSFQGGAPRGGGAAGGPGAAGGGRGEAPLL